MLITNKPPLVFPAYTRKQHRQVLKQYKDSLADATWKNKAVHLTKLVQFCELHKLDPLRLREYDVLAYIVFLKTKLKSPGAALNYLSTARTWLLAVSGKAKQFDTYKVSVMKKGLPRVMKHEPSPTPALLPDQLRYMVEVLDQLGPAALPAKALLLIGYFSALRQSNLLGSHVILTRDVLYTPTELTIHVRSSKTITTARQQVTLVIPCIPKSTCCPVRAWRDYVRKVKPNSAGPALTVSNHARMSVASVTRLLRLTLSGSSYPDPTKFTLHALRRGAVHGCVQAGATRTQIRDLGQWASNSVNTYLPPKVVKRATSTLTAYFG